MRACRLADKGFFHLLFRRPLEAHCLIQYFAKDYLVSLCKADSADLDRSKPSFSIDYTDQAQASFINSCWQIIFHALTFVDTCFDLEC